jgi:hypothetical protein
MDVEGGSPPPTPPPEAPPAVWEDFIDIFFAPADVFERRKGWSAWPILLITTAVLVVLFIGWQNTLGPVMDVEMQRGMAEAMAENPELGPEQIEQMRSMGRIFGPIGLALAFPFGVLITGLVGWGLARMFGAAASFATVFGVVVYSQIVRVLQYLAGILQAFVLDVEAMDSVHDVSLSAARFLDQPDASALVVNLAARVDVFTLWATALIAIGLAVTTKLSKGSAWAVAILIWLLAAVPTLIGPLMSGG